MIPCHVRALLPEERSDLLTKWAVTSESQLERSVGTSFWCEQDGNPSGASTTRRNILVLPKKLCEGKSALCKTQ